MSGLLALLDDVAAIAKMAAAQVDDIAAHAAKATGKSAGVVVDDAAVTPKYVTGIAAARELPMVGKIAAGSLVSKLVILLPALLLLQALAPWVIAPLLLLGGCYLCFEGAEKVWHWIVGHDEAKHEPGKPVSAAHLEEQQVKGAIKTDFILSAEIMTIALSTIEVPMAESFGTACTGAAGIDPAISSVGLPRVGNRSFATALTDARPQVWASLLVGARRADLSLFGAEPVALNGGPAVIAHGNRQEVVLDIGVFDARMAADEGGTFELVRGTGATTRQKPAAAYPGLPEKVPVTVEGNRLFRGHLDVDLEMVLEVRADAGRVPDHLDPVGSEVCTRTDAR